MLIPRLQYPAACSSTSNQSVNTIVVAFLNKGIFLLAMPIEQIKKTGIQISEGYKQNRAEYANC
jgi:hypothetical protein